MANGAKNDMSFQDFKRLTAEEREFFIFDSLCQVGSIASKLDSMDERYSSKWVERGAKALAYTVGTAIIVAVLALVIKQ
jgi:hypothetical protein